MFCFFVAPSPCGPQAVGPPACCTMSLSDLLSSINFWSSVISCGLSLVLSVVMGLCLILFHSYYFVGLLERKTEKGMTSISVFSLLDTII